MHNHEGGESSSMQPVWQLTRGRALAASLVTLGLLIWIWALPEQDAAGNPLAVAALLGAAFGVVLQRGRFCFYCNATDWLSRRRAQGLLAIIIALAVGAAAHTAIVSGWLADPRSGRLPLDGHIGPVSWVLFVASLVFGLGMAMSGSCLSAHMYRLGEGHLASVLALLGALLGFIAAFAVWNAISVQVIHEAPPLWLPNYLGYGGSLLLALLILAGLAWALTHWQRADPAAHHSRPPAPPPAQAQLGHLLFAHKWGPGVTGVAVGLIAIVAYVRLAPLGVTAEMGSVARSLGTSLGAIPERLEGLDSLRGCATVVKEHLWSANGVFVLGLVLASWASALIAGECRPSWPRPWVASRIFLGGILLGFGAMLAIGCTIGVLLSGIMIGAVSGWIFALGCFLGVWLGWWIRQRLAQN